jgi:dTDP-4-dehydrorhamnose reductase
MNILLLGHNGYLGNYIKNNFECDILNERNVYNNGKKYDYVINCIGKPDVDFCEKNELISQYSNCDVILDIKKNYPDSKIINFSSYYCYDYDGACNENSPVTEKYNYMRHKLMGERYNKNGLNLRVGKLFGNKNKDQGKFFDYIIKNESLTCDEIFFNPCSVYCIKEVLEFEFKNKNLFGLYNCANNGCPSHYEFASFVSSFFLNKNVIRIDKLKRNFSNYGKFFMDLSKLQSILKLKYWQYDVEKYFEAC